MSLSSLPRSSTELLLEEQFRYTYDRPIRHLRHRLIVIPRGTHGEQLRTDFGVSASDERAAVTISQDQFANCVVKVGARAVRDEITFSVWATVRTRGSSETHEPRLAARDPRFLRPTGLTHASEQIADVGRQIAASGQSNAVVGELACSWARQAITYGYGYTDVDTSATGALALGKGVCQDYAHIMLAVCRAAGVPARYVSGHLTGEGGSHAWVEVLDAAPSGAGAIARGFDPTHERATDARYLTVAVGRDYHDVAPTSGTFRGSSSGSLDVMKRVAEVESQVA